MGPEGASSTQRGSVNGAPAACQRGVFTHLPTAPECALAGCLLPSTCLSSSLAAARAMGAGSGRQSREGSLCPQAQGCSQTSPAFGREAVLREEADCALTLGLLPL